MTHSNIDQRDDDQKKKGWGMGEKEKRNIVNTIVISLHGGRLLELVG